MKLNKEKFLKFIEILKGYAEKMKDTDVIDTNKMSITSVASFDENPDKFQVKVMSENDIALLKKLKWSDFKKGHDYRIGIWYRNRHSSNIYEMYSYQKFPKTKVVTVEEVRQYVESSGGNKQQ